MGLFSGIIDTVTSAAKSLQPLSNLVSPYVTAATSFLGGQERNQSQIEQSSAQQAFQERMSSTSYQRAVEDMKAAGLNPMLAYQQGGASTPVGSMAVLTNPAADAAEAYNRSVAAGSCSAEAAARIPTYQAEIDYKKSLTGLTKAQVKQVEANTDKIIEETRNIPIEGDRLKQAVFTLAAQENLMRQQSYSEMERQRMMIATILKLKEETNLLRFDVEAARDLGNLGREYGQLKPVIDTLIRVLGARSR